MTERRAGGAQRGRERNERDGGEAAAKKVPARANLDGKVPTRREEIVRVATRLFSDRGYEGASMEMLAQAVGLRKASLFHHFASKDALYDEVLGGLLSDVSALLETAAKTDGPYLARLAGFADALGDVWGARPYAARLLFREAMDRGPVMQKWLGNALQTVLVASLVLLDEGKRLGHFSGMDAKQVIMSLVGVHLVPFALDDVTAAFIGELPDTPGALAIRKIAVRAQILALAGSGGAGSGG